ncbi:MAG: ZIP family metal transporter [Acutalibacteraceae bacterium]
MAETIIGIIAPFAGTTLGAASTLMMKRKISNSTNEIFIAVTLGIMLAATVSLISSCEDLLPLSAGFVIGVGVMVALELLTKLSGDKRMMLAITVHNIPEGMAVGAAFAAATTSGGYVAALSLAVIAVEYAEGAVVGLMFREKGRFNAFLRGTATGVVEPVFSVLTLLFSVTVTAALPYLLAFSAGAMIYVCIRELAPKIESAKGAFASCFGFIIMLILDIALG